MTLNNSELVNPDWVSGNTQHLPHLNQELEKLALFAAQAWKDDHPRANLNFPEDFDACVLYVTAELAAAARAVGGLAGLIVLTGGGSKAARTACKHLLAATQTYP